MGGEGYLPGSGGDRLRDRHRAVRRPADARAAWFGEGVAAVAIVLFTLLVDAPGANWIARRGARPGG
jgi:hypothetical protein